MISRTIGHFAITAELGKGGMGVVYRAHDTTLDRDVALKFLPPHLTADPEARARFIHEAKAASSLQHPAICTIHEIGESEDGQTYLVMPCDEGLTLEARLKHGVCSTKSRTVLLNLDWMKNWLGPTGSWVTRRRPEISFPGGWSRINTDPSARPRVLPFWESLTRPLPSWKKPMTTRSTG